MGIPPRGVEPPRELPENRSISSEDDAESGAQCASNDHIDVDLRHVVDAWRGLSEPIKAAILAIVKSAQK